MTPLLFFFSTLFIILSPLILLWLDNMLLSGIRSRRRELAESLRDKYRGLSSSLWGTNHERAHATWTENHNWLHATWIREFDAIHSRYRALKTEAGYSGPEYELLKLQEDEALARLRLNKDAAVILNDSIRNRWTTENAIAKNLLWGAGDVHYREVTSTPTLVFWYRNLAPVKRKAENNRLAKEADELYRARLLAWELEEADLQEKFHQIALTTGNDFDKLFPVATQMVQLDERKPQR